MTDPMIVRIIPVTDPVDIPKLADIMNIAFGPDKFYTFIEKHSPLSVFDETVSRLTEAINDPCSAVFKAVIDVRSDNGVGTTEKIIGFSQWFCGYIKLSKFNPFSMETVVEAAEEVAIVGSDGPATAQSVSAVMSDGPPTMLDLNTELGRNIGNVYIGKIRGKKHIYLRRLMIHPSYQKRGVGQKLLEWGVKKADEEKIVGWLLSRPAGSKLYERAGWKAVASIDIGTPDMEVPPLIAMLRQPRVQQ